MRRMCLWLLVLLLLSAAPALAQTVCNAPGPCAVARNQPFTVLADWSVTQTEPDPADGFRLWQNGAIVRDVPATLLVNGVISFSFPAGIAVAGDIVFTVSTYNGGGDAQSDPLTVSVLRGKPAKPRNVRESH